MVLATQGVGIDYDKLRQQIAKQINENRKTIAADQLENAQRWYIRKAE